MSMLEYIRGEKKFFVLLAGLYTCSLLSALNHERLLKKPFNHKITGEPEFFHSVFLITFVSHLVTALVGKVILIARKQSSSLPWRDCTACGLVINLGSFGYNSAIIHTSFPAVVMVKSCSLLSVILVGVGCSRVRDKKLHLGREKILVGVLACAGIFCFNFGANPLSDTENKPLQIFSIGTLFLLASLLGDGFLPDFQAKLKSQHKPTAIQLYYSVNFYVALVALLLLVASGEAISSFKWLFEHEGAAKLLLMISFLNAMTQLFVYQMVKEYRQHVPAFAIATRKCITVLLSLFWYRHSIALLQGFGIVFVFVSIFLEVYTNYLNSIKQNELGKQQGEILKEVDMEKIQILNEMNSEEEQAK